MTFECDGKPIRQKMLHIPDMHVNWPARRTINPHYEEIWEESRAWLGPLGSFPKLSQSFRWREALERTDPGLLASLVYPRAAKEHLRTGCDIMQLFVVLEEATDGKPEYICREVAEIVIDVLNEPNKTRIEGEGIIGQITQQFWQLALKTATPCSAKHLVESFTDYLKGVVNQAKHRDEKTVLTVEEYLRNRRSDVGTRPAFAVGELHLNLPDQVFYHSIVKEMESLITDLIIFFNDVVSFNWEQFTGSSDFNLLSVVMRQFDLNLDGAVAWISQAHEAAAEKYLSLAEQVPSFGPEVDKELADYLNFLENWPRGNASWSFEGRRYFGDKGLEVQRTRCVELLLKIH